MVILKNVRVLIRILSAYTFVNERKCDCDLVNKKVSSGLSLRKNKRGNKRKVVSKKRYEKKNTAVMPSGMLPRQRG